jgi:NAD(P)-dependent dehydrogenase (short-subunit alcohol dehydrogenase family)
MDTATLASHASRQPELLGQTVVVIGGSAGIGLETARRARAEGADVILTKPRATAGRRKRTAALRTAAFDANDPPSLERFFLDLPAPIDHVMVTGPGPRYRTLMEMEFEQARLAISEHILLALWVARNAASKVRPGATLLFMGGTGARRPARGLALVSAVTAAMPAFVAASPSTSRRSGSISSPRASSTRRCRQRSSAMISTRAAISSAPLFPSGGSSVQPTWRARRPHHDQ